MAAVGGTGGVAHITQFTAGQERGGRTRRVWLGISVPRLFARGIDAAEVAGDFRGKWGSLVIDGND